MEGGFSSLFILLRLEKTILLIRKFGGACESSTEQVYSGHRHTFEKKKGTIM